MNLTLARTTLLAAAVLATFAGCNNDTLSAEQRAQLTSDLKDPESAQFRNGHSGKSGALCGEMNAKNSMGGYVGFKRYILADPTHYIEGSAPVYKDGLPTMEDTKAELDVLTAVQVEHQSNPISEADLGQITSQRLFEMRWKKLCSDAKT